MILIEHTTLEAKKKNDRKLELTKCLKRKVLVLILLLTNQFDG